MKGLRVALSLRIPSLACPSISVTDMNTSTSEVIAVVIAQPTFISQEVFILTSIRTLEGASTIVSLKRQVLWVLQPVKITWEISKHLILYIGVRLLTTLPPSGGLGYNKSHVRKYYIVTSFLFTEVKGSNLVQA